MGADCVRSGRTAVGVASAVGEGEGARDGVAGRGVAGKGEAVVCGISVGEGEISRAAELLHPLMDTINNTAMMRTAAFFIKVSLHKSPYEYSRKCILCQGIAFFGAFL